MGKKINVVSSFSLVSSYYHSYISCTTTTVEATSDEPIQKI